MYMGRDLSGKHCGCLWEEMKYWEFDLNWSVRKPGESLKDTR